jgi:cytochrome c oxidase cbb3-type subunit 1
MGIVLYITAMWVSGIMQGLMWRSFDHLGFLQFSFIETVEAMHPFYVIRALGGVLFLTGGLIMAYNLIRTARGEIRTEEAMVVEAPLRPRPVPAE